MFPVRESSGANNAPQLSATTQHNTGAATEFSQAMSSNAPAVRPPASGRQRGGVDPQTGQGTSMERQSNSRYPIYQGLVAAHVNNMNQSSSIIPRSLRPATAALQVRFAGGLTRGNVEVRANEVAQQRLTTGAPAPAQDLSGTSEAENAGKHSLRQATAAIDQGTTADEAIRTYGVQNPTSQLALRQFEDGHISRSNAVMGIARDPSGIPKESAPVSSAVENGQDQSSGSSPAASSDSVQLPIQGNASSDSLQLPIQNNTYSDSIRLPIQGNASSNSLGN